MTGGIVCAGNWIVDIVHTIDSWPSKSELVTIRDEAIGVGGGAANVALNLAAFASGLQVMPVGLLGADTHGATVRATCRSSGLPDRWLVEAKATPTAHTHVMNVPGDSRTFFYNPGTNDLLAEGHVPVEDLAAAGARIFYVGYVNLLGSLDRADGTGSTGTARLLARARAAGMMTCVDLVSALTPDFAATVEAALPETDTLFLNEIEAARATGLPVADPGDRAALMIAAETLRTKGAGRVVLHTATLALWLDANGVQWSTPDAIDPAKIVSPLGAGDAFCAGVMFGLHHEWTAAQCLTLGHRAAAACLGNPTATGGMRKLSELWPDHPPLEA